MDTMKRHVITSRLSWFFIITVLSMYHIGNVLPLSCYTCSNTQTPSASCLESRTCGFDEVCMNTIRDENGLHIVSKECKQTATCNNHQSENENQCHPETSPSLCYYCCDTDLCNEQEIPGTLGATTAATTNIPTTLIATTTTFATTEGATTSTDFTSTIRGSTQQKTTSTVPSSETELQGATTTLRLTTNLQTSPMTETTAEDALSSSGYRGTTTQPNGFVSCYTCLNTQTPNSDCVGSMICGLDEVCMNTIRDENGLHIVSKECKQTATCNNHQNQNENQCHPEISPSLCYYCCNTDLCNAFEIPFATVVTRPASMTKGTTTLPYITSSISESTAKETTSIIPTTSTTEHQGATTTRTSPLEMSTESETSKMATTETDVVTTTETDVSTSMSQIDMTQSALTSTINQDVAVAQSDGIVSCYVCSNTQTASTDCLESMICGFDEVCMNTIRDENGLHIVSKECKQTAACNNHQSQNENECHPEISPSLCYYCCGTDLCNAFEIPLATFVTRPASTTKGITILPHVTSTIGESAAKETTAVISTTGKSEQQGATATSPLEVFTESETSKMTTTKTDVSTSMLQRDTTESVLTNTVNEGEFAQPDGIVSCYICSDTQTPSTDCLGSMICGFDEVCMNTIRDENGLHIVSKECKQTATCNNHQSQNNNQCHPETSPSLCYYCCDTDLCNEQEIPSTVGATTAATTNIPITTAATTEVATTSVGTTEYDSTMENLSCVEVVIFNLIGQATIPPEEVFMTESTGNVIRCAMLCRSQSCMKFAFDLTLNFCQLSRQASSIGSRVPKQGSMLYRLTE